jgi:hypothetical protein
MNQAKKMRWEMDSVYLIDNKRLAKSGMGWCETLAQLKGVIKGDACILVLPCR